MRYACLNGGKRLRPVLVYGAAKSVGGDFADADRSAMAVELIHCYSLAHDDLPAMDDDDLRRGKPTLHKAFDEATAILVGDALQSLAFRLLAESGTPGTLDAATHLKMIKILGLAAENMVVGQALDFAAVGTALRVDELAAMHKLKTGALIRASVLLGGLSCKSVTEQELASLEHYADCIGLAFQIQDDILDGTADTQTLGKPQGSDHNSNKPTYLSLLGQIGAREKAAELVDEAQSAISGFGEAAEPLRALAIYIASRGH